MSKIILLTDQPNETSEFSEQLSTHGYIVQTLPYSKQGLDILLTNQPDLIILDLHNSAILNTSYNQAIRKRHPDLPILMISEFSDDLIDLDCLGCNSDYLSKPFHPQHALQKINKLIKRSQTYKADLQGNIESMGGVLAIIQSLGQLHLSGKLTIENCGSIYLNNSIIVHAESDNRNSYSALKWLSRESSGRFLFYLQQSSSVRSLNINISYFVMDTLKQQDETPSYTMVMPSIEAVLSTISDQHLEITQQYKKNQPYLVFRYDKLELIVLNCSLSDYYQFASSSASTDQPTSPAGPIPSLSTNGHPPNITTTLAKSSAVPQPPLHLLHSALTRP